VEWSLYLVRRADGALYTGIARDVERRLEQHRAGRGAKALRGRGPMEIAYQVTVGDHGVTLALEHRIKRLPKGEKERLVADAPKLARLLEKFEISP
jgi:putative endonuclease